MKKVIIVPIVIKAIIAVLFFCAIGYQPYSYYQFIKFAAFVGFGVLIAIYKDEYYIEAVIAAIGVMLFNPFYKVSFKRDTWQEIDYWIAISCAVWILADIVKIFVLLRHEDKKAKE
jgi:hypothetical protein